MSAQLAILRALSTRSRFLLAFVVAASAAGAAALVRHALGGAHDELAYLGMVAAALFGLAALVWWLHVGDTWRALRDAGAFALMPRLRSEAMRHVALCAAYFVLAPTLVSALLGGDVPGTLLLGVALAVAGLVGVNLLYVALYVVAILALLGVLAAELGPQVTTFATSGAAQALVLAAVVVLEYLRLRASRSRGDRMAHAAMDDERARAERRLATFRRWLRVGANDAGLNVRAGAYRAHPDSAWHERRLVMFALMPPARAGLAVTVALQFLAPATLASLFSPPWAIGLAALCVLAYNGTTEDHLSRTQPERELCALLPRAGGARLRRHIDVSLLLSTLLLPLWFGVLILGTVLTKDVAVSGLAVAGFGVFALLSTIGTMLAVRRGGRWRGASLWMPLLPAVASMLAAVAVAALH